MQTLEQLRSGELLGTTTLKLSEGLTTFPKEVYTLADTLERLDMTCNELDALPDDFYKLKNLKILFLSDNNFTRLPEVLAKCPQLSMIGFRNNQITEVPENSLPLTTRWLILTDNAIEALPQSMGELQLLQKCMLSGNRLKRLPESMANCHHLELLRIAVNELEELPPFLLTLPKLSWLAYGGNPFCAKHPNVETPLDEIAWNILEIEELLGEGASGHIFKAVYQGRECAVKVFKGEITSDGLPSEEMDINISLGHHEHLVDVLARVTGHPEGKDVLMLELIPPHFFNLGLPPTLETCSRDVYEDGLRLTLAKTYKILLAMASAAEHMHAHGIMHGDFYAHNIMIDDEGNSILGDFGGASYFEPEHMEERKALERLEVRAFGCLIEEMLMLSIDDISHEHTRTKLTELKEKCLDEENHKRPLFQEVLEFLEKIT
jgi:hypothetical protein